MYFFHYGLHITQWLTLDSEVFCTNQFDKFRCLAGDKATEYAVRARCMFDSLQISKYDFQFRSTWVLVLVTSGFIWLMNKSMRCVTHNICHHYEFVCHVRADRAPTTTYTVIILLQLLRMEKNSSIALHYKIVTIKFSECVWCFGWFVELVAVYFNWMFTRCQQIAVFTRLTNRNRKQRLQVRIRCGLPHTVVIYATLCR